MMLHGIIVCMVMLHPVYTFKNKHKRFIFCCVKFCMRSESRHEPRRRIGFPALLDATR